MVFVFLPSNHIVIITHCPAEKLVSLVRAAWMGCIQSLDCTVVLSL